jgi:hypothetical protein
MRRPVSESIETTVAPKELEAVQPVSRFRWLAWSSLVSAFLQSVCTALIALSGIRLLIGAAAFAGAFGVVKLADKLHGEAIRIPMMVFALLGSLANLAALWQVWRLRRRSASAWRRQAVPRRKRNSERLQLVLAVLTLLLLAVEFWAHRKLFGS